ncbi:MAG: hypothetical protein HFF17_09375 [Oscillospiraceae bacterium]|nr:hypothetical protein [Oscillospiraceae bacterium]
MKWKHLTLAAAILWFAVAVMWVAMVAIRWTILPGVDGLFMLQTLVAALSLAAGLVTLHRWRAARCAEQSSENSR